MNEDREQLRRYAETGSEDAFAAVVQGYLPLVFSAALRGVRGDVHQAEDVTQLVFTALARNARTVARHPEPIGWLFTTTRFLTAKTLRGEQRRRLREQEAFNMQNDLDDHPTSRPPAHLQPMLDEVMMDLRQLDREVLLLRFYRGLRLTEIGARLNVTENAVQKRLDRALEQMRYKLSGRGITSTAAAIFLALEQQGLAAVPAGLAASATSAGLAGGAIGAGTFWLLNLMTISKIQIGIAGAVIAAGSTGLVLAHRENTRLRSKLATQMAAGSAEATQLRKLMAIQAGRTAEAEGDLGKLAMVLQASAGSPSGAAHVSIGNGGIQERVNGQAVMSGSINRARELIKEGKLQEALDEYIMGYGQLRAMADSGSPWNQILMDDIKDLGGRFSPAVAALRDLRDTAMRQAAENSKDRNLTTEVALLNIRLGEENRTVALLDSMPNDDPRRQSLALISYNALVESQRYADAMAGKSFGSMLNEFQNETGSAAKSTGLSRINARNYAIGNTLRDIEVLTGAGRLDEAGMLTEKLLSVDDSDATRALVKQHVDRARQSAIP